MKDPRSGGKEPAYALELQTSRNRRRQLVRSNPSPELFLTLLEVASAFSLGWEGAEGMELSTALSSHLLAGCQALAILSVLSETQQQLDMTVLHVTLCRTRPTGHDS